MKKFLSCLLLVVVALGFVACSKTPTSVDPTGVTINASKTSINVGESVTLTATVNPSGASQSVSWRSEDTTIATVDSKGSVKGVAAGTVSITATSKANSKISANVQITVTASDVNPTEITISGAEGSLAIGSTMSLSASVLPAGASQNVLWSSSDSAIATVDQTGKVTAVAAGNVAITATSAVASSVSKTVNIAVSGGTSDLAIKVEGDATNLNVGKSLSLEVLNGGTDTFTWTLSDDTLATVTKNDLTKATLTAKAAGELTIYVSGDTTGKMAEVTLTLEAVYVKLEAFEINTKAGNYQVTCGSSASLAATFYPEGATATVTYSMASEDIAKINNNKRIQGLEIGTATVHAVAVDPQGVTLEIDTDFYVVETSGPISINPSSVVIVGSHLVYEGDKINLQATVYENGAPQNVIWSSSDESVATVDAKGNVTGIKEGEAYIVATALYKSSEGTEVKSDAFKMNVKIKPEVKPYTNLNGYNITIMQASGAISEVDPHNDGYTAIDKDAKIEAWTDAETNSNCKITVEPYPAEAPWGPIRNAWIIKQAALGAAQSDFYIEDSSFLKQLVDGNSALDVSQFYENYGENTMPIVSQQALSYKGGLWGISIRTSYSIPVYYGFFYNYGLLKELGLEDPATFFNDGTWTYSKFKEWAETAQTALPEGSYVFTGRWCYTWFAMAAAAGIRMVDTTAMKVNVDDQYAVSIYDLLKSLYAEGCWDPASSGDTSSSFNEGKALVHQGEFWFVKGSDRWPSNLWGEGSTEFGYVPYPWPDNMTKDESRISVTSESFWMMASKRQYPDGVDAESVYRATQEILNLTSTYLMSDLGYDDYEQRYASAEAKLSNPAGITAMAYWTADQLLFDPLITLQTFDAVGIGTAVDSGVKNGTMYEEITAQYKSTLEGLLQEKFG